MSKAEKFIQDCTRNCSNEYDLPECFENGIERLKEYQPWLTPDQAKRAVEIARNEIYEWLAKHKDMQDYTWYDEIEHESGITDKCIADLKQAMKNE